MQIGQWTTEMKLLSIDQIGTDLPPLQRSVPLQIDQSTSESNFTFHTISEAHGRFTMIAVHWWQIPNIGDHSPRSDQHENMPYEGLFLRVPVRIGKTWIVLDGHRINGCIHFEATLFEHHHGRIVDARSLGKDKYGQLFALGVLTKFVRYGLNGNESDIRSRYTD